MSGCYGGYNIIVRGQGPVVVNMSNRCLSVGPDRCGIFNHGWDGSYLFGEGPKSVDEAQAPIEAAGAQIKKLFPSAFLSHIRTGGDVT
jgi:hypothetical protein